MSKWKKLVEELYSQNTEIRFEEIRKILENIGYKMKETGSGSSHVTFRKAGCMPVTIPRHKNLKKAYIELVREVVEKEDSDL